MASVSEKFMNAGLKFDEYAPPAQPAAQAVKFR
jgi:hypothetical protein